MLTREMANSSDKPFLFLLLMVLAMGCWYGPGLEPSEIAPAAELANMRKAYLRVICSNFMDLMDTHALQARYYLVLDVVHYERSNPEADGAF